MTDKQFEALTRLMRSPGGASTEALRLMLVHGTPVAEAARAVGVPYRYAWNALKRARDTLTLARAAAGEGG